MEQSVKMYITVCQFCQFIGCYTLQPKFKVIKYIQRLGTRFIKNAQVHPSCRARDTFQQ